ncbi:cytochrome P450 [Thozetella sp. PMI_491]|nr:cytochrome P450 [Thozetella sp. PMI_491]
MALIQLVSRPSLGLLALGMASVLGLILWSYVVTPRLRRKGVPLPPGPPSEPILGHLRVVPEYSPEYTYQRWSKEYGSDVLHLNVLGQDIVVLNSVQSAVDLLDRRGANYCDRPRFVLFEVMGWGRTLTFLRWGPAFRLHRKILQKSFQKSNIVQYRPLQERETLVFLKGLVQRPEQWETLLRRFATAVVMSIGFGVEVKADDDKYIQIAVDASYALGHGGAPAGTLVDFFPFFKHFPNWLLQNRALKFARDWRWAIQRLHDVPYADLLSGGGETRSLAQALLEESRTQLEKGGSSELTEDDIKGAAAAVYAAGQDTTWSALIVWILNMVLHPDIQAKAQKMIDEVIGPDRLPTFEDREKLPYIDNLVQETLRWCPVSPIGVPHRSLEDDIYNGMFIPKGSFVYANARAMTHDERIYHDPDAFDPDRYLSVEKGGRGEPFPAGQFGFGRRVCVGKHLAEASMWIMVASLLATFNIEKAVGPDGKEITPEVELTDGLTSHPKQFPCRIRPRSDLAAQLVMESTG